MIKSENVKGSLKEAQVQRISYSQWIRNIQQGSHLDPEEQAELHQWLNVQAGGPKTWEEYESIAVHLGELIARANGCQCFEDVRAQYRFVVRNFREASHGNLELLQDVRHPCHKDHWKLNITLARKFARERRCHGLMHGFLCYCDEHKH